MKANFFIIVIGKAKKDFEKEINDFMATVE